MAELQYNLRVGHEERSGVNFTVVMLQYILQC
jgi:hypothetical protein